MKKKILGYAAVIIFLFIGLLSAPAIFAFFEDKLLDTTDSGTINMEAVYGEYKPKLWVTENADKTNKVYLFGTIHIGIPEMYPLPNKIISAFNDSKYLAVESNIVELEADSNFMYGLIAMLTYDDGSVLKDHLSEETYKGLEKAAKRVGIAIHDDDAFKPFFYISVLDELMDNSKYKSEYGVDRNLIYDAYKKNIGVKEIENAMYTYELLSGMSDTTQEVLLKEMLPKDYWGLRNIFSRHHTFKAWVNGKIDEVMEIEFNQDNLKEDEIEPFNEYMDALFHKRNAIMTEKVIEYLDTGEVHFFAVGAAHYSGNTGIVNRLRDLGFTVEEIAY